ncbi:hydrocephalus-inducing protein-like [Pezoporus occidentalis]|uniref:hydrocephalus-inducing protein-like n=1 Tax=Pezoporus occidentalis TaxID=407982 RepID=UPI002F91A33F
MHPVKCKVARIAFQLPPEEVMDWDDHLHTIEWMDASRDSAATWPVRKVIKTTPEPAHTVLEKSSREVELHLSAVVDYAEFQMDVDMIQFKETLLFQTRTVTFQLSNTGNVALEYTWMAAVEDERSVNRTGELLLSNLNGDSLSSTCGTSGKLHPSRCSSQLDHELEHVSSSLNSSLNAISGKSPFSVEPRSGTIPVGQKQLFQMKFSPVYVGDFESCMLCSIPNLTPNQKCPEVAVKGKSLMTNCHFELEDSDYLTANRRNPKLPDPKETVLDHNTRVIEFVAIGVCSRSSRTFTVTNPTSSAYSFQWTCQDPEAPRGQEAFFCLTERGQIQPGKKAEMKFQFIPQHLDVTESFWIFTVPEQNISVPVLLVGNASDPLVTLNRSHLSFQLLLIGHEVRQTMYMINSEKEAFSFAFRESSLFSEGCKASVKVEPLKGSIGPLSRLPITVSFIPTIEGEVVFNLKCDVKRKTQPLSLNIKATSYSMNVSVGCQDSDGHVTELSAHKINIIDLKEVQLNENIKRIFSICNNSRFSFTFTWELCGPAACQQVLTITPWTGTLQAEEKAESQLAFHSQKLCSLKDVKLTLRISKGPTFTLISSPSLPPQVDVVDPPGKVVKLGNVCIGQTVKKIVTIANKSAAPLAFQLRVTSTAPELQEAGVLCLKPSKELKLKPRGDRGKVEVTFSPKRRIQPFSGEVLLECGGLARSLFVVRGSCQGSLVSLDQEQLSFGAVVQQSYTWRRVVMRNAGDTGVRFTWDVESFKPDFSISPTKGYISPGRDVPFVVTFRPSKLSQAVQYEGLRCFIQGSEALRLTLSGSCVEAPGPKETLTFSCSVRERQSQTILLSNPSNEAWTLQPIIEGKYWKGPEFIHLEARQKEKAYQVTYRPLSMSSENKKHQLAGSKKGKGALQFLSAPLAVSRQGSIFFPLPDGTGLRYHLEGTAEAPRCSGAISRQVPCRSSHTELIPVSNWLHRPQRLLVVIDMLKPENVESSSVLQGCSYIDVPSSAKKDYQLTFFSYKEGVFRAKVTFLNETTGEYLFHVVTFKVTASGPIGTVKMSTAVRQRVSSTVKVDNPLPVPVTFDITCEVPDVSAPQHFTVPAQSKADLVLEYQPLKTGESTGHLVLQSSDLGSLSYNLQLKAISHRPEKPVYFRTTLGSRQTITTKIRNFAQQKTEYLLQTDCADFQTAKSISAAPAGAGGSDLSVEVTFEPCQLGEAKATLQLSSALGGQYRIPLIGLALPPEAQGPFLIPAGGSTSISFRNVFPKATAFQYAVKHPAFTAEDPSAPVPRGWRTERHRREGLGAQRGRLRIAGRQEPACSAWVDPAVHRGAARGTEPDRTGSPGDGGTQGSAGLQARSPSKGSGYGGCVRLPLPPAALLQGGWY